MGKMECLSGASTSNPTLEHGPKLDTVKRRIQIVVFQCVYDILDTLYTCLHRVCNKIGTETKIVNNDIESAMAR